MDINLVVVFLISIFLSILIIRVTVSLMYVFSLADEPDDAHKLHDMHTPFVGGIGVLAALCYALTILINHYPEHLQKCIVLAACSILIYITGFVDDAIKLGYKLRFVIQTIVALLMIIFGGVVLHELGGLLFGFPLQLGVFGIAFTLIATIGGINALNMIDGIDGLSGSIALTSLLLIGVTAYLAEDHHNLILICALAGGVIGFLYYNLRHFYQHRARVFLGDNGSMLLGLMFAWLLVDLSQNPNPAITPVTAIWLFSVPLMDMFGVMLRRMSAGQSPFAADRQHLHHLLMRSGLRVTEIVFTMVFLHCLLGIIGLTGMYLGVPEFTMLLGFIIVSTGYFYLTYKPLRFIALLRNFHILLNTRLGFAPVSNNKVLIGNYTKNETEVIAKTVSDELGPELDYWLRVFKKSPEPGDSGKKFAITLHIWLDKKDRASKDMVRLYIASLQRQLIDRQGIHLHRFSNRKTDFDSAIDAAGGAFGESKVKSRRRLGPQALSFEVVR
ncbi:MraY family glycosyltransferase [Nitrosomonas sp.]|uniref:MraY family glycosyltransferase n=1 Tax=Nitrosomonas sp. TaxID=42353 RepID=UPI001DE19BFE|nr:MraY family glycosyltransferase [Nitrosomonas sp.]MBX3617920.1 undecaprenyl/decaprenyl-phosphate alpha-N-acetylglucosaminyl 1-phosphate transferase [Nitrosomonas sp.]